MGKEKLRALTLCATSLGAVFYYGYKFRGKTENHKWEVAIPEKWEKEWQLKNKVKPIVKLGNLIPGSTTAIALSCIAYPLNKKKWWVPLTSFVTTAVVVKILGKPFFRHELNGGLGYPSSHSSVAFSAMVGFVYILPHGMKFKKLYTTPPVIAAALLPLGVYVGNHHRLSEVVAGVATGASIAKIYATV